MLENSDIQSNNKRIAKNTLYLYVRMFLMMGIAFYTSRVILQVLGVEDYGIYNVVGGLVSMFGILNGSMSSASQRYITVALGERNIYKLKKIFSTCLQIHVIIGILTILLIETIGLWFLYNKMVIPAERTDAAFWVLQFSAASFFFSVISVPYNAEIIANERMSAFAYISIIEACLKLGIVFLLIFMPFDKLIIYSLLLVMVQIGIQLCYMTYCHRQFEESHYIPVRDTVLMKEMTAFAGWNMFGGMSSIAFGQGLSMLLNVFFGPVVNAARGIAQQVQSAIQVFITNFQMALNPQIIKNYASSDFPQMHLLMERSSRFSYCLMLLLSMPVLFECPFILQIWLGVVPDNAVIFLRLIITTTLLYTIINPILAANNATGKVRTYYVVCGCLMISILPISYVVLRLGAPAYSVFVVHFCVELFTQIVRLLMVRKRLRLSIRKYIKNVYFPIVATTVLSAIIPYIVWAKTCDDLNGFLVVSTVCVISVGLCAATFGITSHERQFLIAKARIIISRRR